MGASMDLGYTLTIVTSVTLGITTLAVLLRCYVRLILQKRFSADDYLILFSYTNLCAFMYCALEAGKHGIGKHMVAVYMKNPMDIIASIKYWWLAQNLFVFATCTVKVSVAVFFCSLCPPRYLRLTAIAMACISVINGLGVFFYHIFSCTPVAYTWNRVNPAAKGSCLPFYPSFVILQVVNTIDVFTDVILAVLPCIMVWNMTMARVKKFGVSILLGWGGLASISAIIRAFYFKNMLMSDKDFTYVAWPITITSTIEPAIGITVVCLAHLRPLLKQIFPKGWFTIDERSASSDVTTFGQIGGRSLGIVEISLHEELNPGTYSQRPVEWNSLKSLA